jgi:YidC/Oxa1 family membrane protein insertase
LDIFNLILLHPTLNVLIVLSSALFSSFGLAVIALTAIVRLVMLPLTWKQLKTSKKMTESMNALKPKLEQLKKKYAKNPQKLQQETMNLYKEAGISPLGCLSSPMMVSLIVQLPIFIALYRAIVQALAVTPQDFLGLSQSVYSWPIVNEAVPVSGHFLWLNLATADPYFILPILVAATMWVSQKMIAQPSTDPQQQTTQTMMQIMMPLMFAFITLSLPAGLGLYFVVSGIASIVIEYFVYGWGNLFKRAPAQAPEKKLKAVKGPIAPQLPSTQIPGKSAGLTDRVKSFFSGLLSEPASTQQGPSDTDLEEKTEPKQDSSPQEGKKYGKSGGKRQDGRRSR